MTSLDTRPRSRAPALPDNASGKLVERDLRDQFAHLAADIDGGRAAAASGASPTGGNR